jgi:hypothetical protein
MAIVQRRLLGIIAMVLATLYPQASYAAPVPCTPSDQQIAAKAQSDARSTLKAVNNYIRGNDSSTKTLFKRWFGSNDGAATAKVSDVFERSRQWINTVSFFCLYQNDGGYTEDVQTPAGTIRVDVSGGLFAYVNPAELGKVYLGLKFFNAPATTGYDSQLGTLIHEMTHFWITGNTNRNFDDIYDKNDCLQLAITNSDKASGNAQNYEYFVEEWLQK